VYNSVTDDNFSLNIADDLLYTTNLEYRNSHEVYTRFSFGLFDAHCCHIKHPVPDWVKPSFVIFDIRAL